ncbi:unnamed protein product [Gongylonema pulchrum]|uniref:Degenerin-like protein unc-105 n=1 Tax=Gongylonema pulchrum TaxID=637853 RepID=A0A183ESE9_9BILA|nr:unnamed protein product [Gongylonema pulchrum]
MDGFNGDLCLGLRHEVNVDVRAYYEMLENDDEGTACRHPSNDQEQEFNCRSRCRLHLIREIYNCTAHSLSYLADKDYDGYSPCDYTTDVERTENTNSTDEECLKSCYRNCKQIRFRVDHEIKGPMLNSNLTMVTLNWRSFEYLSLEQNRVYTVTSFIAEIGGSIGVWLGLSVLSLIQVSQHSIQDLLLRYTSNKQSLQNGSCFVANLSHSHKNRNL